MSATVRHRTLLELFGSMQEVRASVFQLTRARAKNIVYVGCLSLGIGIFAMLYIRERLVELLSRLDSYGGL